MPWMFKGRTVHGQTFKSSVAIDSFESAVRQFAEGAKASGLSPEQIERVMFFPARDEAGVFKLRKPREKSEDKNAQRRRSPSKSS